MRAAGVLACPVQGGIHVLQGMHCVLQEYSCGLMVGWAGALGCLNPLFYIETVHTFTHRHKLAQTHTCTYTCTMLLSMCLQRGDAPIPFCIVVGPPKTSSDGELEGVLEAKILYDVLGALVGEGSGVSSGVSKSRSKLVKWQQAHTHTHTHTHTLTHTHTHTHTLSHTHTHTHTHA